jgi:hypothetical protein
MNQKEINIELIQTARKKQIAVFMNYMYHQDRSYGNKQTWMHKKRL